MRWKIIVVLAVLVVLISFGLIFQPGKTEPYAFGVPYVLWTSIGSTLVLVLLTYLGSRNSPYKES